MKAGQLKTEKKLRTVSHGSRGLRKLTDAQVQEIVKLYRAGNVSQRALGAKFGVSGPSISAIMSGQSYAWLTGLGLEPRQVAAAA